MKMRGIKLIICLLVICIIVPCFSAFAAESAVTLSLNCIGSPYVGSEIKIRISAAKPTTALAGLEFVLNYDPEFVTPVLTENTEDDKQMDSFFVSRPNNWEQMCYHSQDGYYQLRFAMPDSGSSYLDTAGELVLEIPFKVKAAGSFGFSLPDGDIIAIAADSKYTPKNGTGSELTVAASSEATKMAIDFTGFDAAPENGIYNLNMTVTNLGDNAGIIGFQFDLKYDDTVFKPTVTDNTQAQMDVFMLEMPQNGWEQMCSFDEESRTYTLRFAANHAESLTEAEILASGKSLLLSVPFKTLGTEGDIGSFYIDYSSVVGINSANGIISGSGDIKSVSVEKGSDAVIPEHLGYEILDHYLLYVPEKTDVSDFLAPLNGFYLTDTKGARVTDGYVKTSHILTDGISVALTVIVRGDGDCNGKAESYDYILAKRAYFNTFTPNRAQFLAMSFYDEDEITKYDYILLKRHHFGTYNINNWDKKS